MKNEITKFSFAEVKYLYDNYGIKKNSQGVFEVFDRKNRQRVFGSDLEPKVKFAHVWVAARQENRSLSYPSSNNSITEEQYSNAFDDDAKLVYNTIMRESVKWAKYDKIPSVESLCMQVDLAISSPYAKNTIRGLYSSHTREEHFSNWVSKAVEYKNSVVNSNNVVR